jgi:hypothetical protein
MPSTRTLEPTGAGLLLVLPKSIVAVGDDFTCGVGSGGFSVEVLTGIVAEGEDSTGEVGIG